ncbi:MAG: hypothetical protein KGD63_03250 [Candidatus Lokiarchaeota archaeon]|nr:hypothetical protein [Candidatus Lokiarchaeota archaeon]
MVKKKRPKKVDIRKKRKKLIKLRKERIDDHVKEKKGKESALDIRLNQQAKLYWSRAVTGVLGGITARLLLGLIGWWMFLWMIVFWFLFPFFASFFIFKFEYSKEEWNWKKIISPGLGIYFFLFMISTTITHTLLTL